MSDVAVIAVMFLGLGMILGALVGWELTTRRALRVLDELNARHARELDRLRAKYPWQARSRSTDDRRDSQ